MSESDDLAARRRMVDEQLRERDITDARVLEAMMPGPRHLFIPPESRHFAYSDGPLRIGQRQTISQSSIVALMTQLLELVGTETVLEVGTGSGYQAAVLARLARQVYTVERSAELAGLARQGAERLAGGKAAGSPGDGSRG